MRITEARLELSLSVVGYQFPHLATEQYDSDWLNIQLELRCGDLHWQRIDPALLTYEIERLCRWLDEAARNAALFGDWQMPNSPLWTEENFIEPNLAFRLESNGESEHPFKLRVYLAAEFLPPFKAQLPHFTLDDTEEVSQVWLDFRASRGDLERLSQELRSGLQKFPIRAGRPESTRPHPQLPPLS